jgi:Kdo2-lipid IVA lauroyltransferase/acyltransferase
MSEWVLQTRKRITRLSLTWLIRLMHAFSRILPYRPGVWAGGALGFVAYYLLPRDRKRALSHLALVYGDKGGAWIHRTARRSFVHLGKAMLELMLISPGRLSRVVDLPDEEKIRAALAAGKGAIFVTGHIGNWELMGAAVAARFTLSVVAAPIEPRPVNDTIVGLRERMGVKTILRGRPGAARELVRVFRENRIMGILIDQDTDVESVFVDFMGRPAWTPTAAASMALKFGAPLVYGYIHRNKDNRHAVHVEGPLDLIRTGDEQKDIIANTAMLTRKIEDSIRKTPEQWVWMHRRWRRQP